MRIPLMGNRLKLLLFYKGALVMKCRCVIRRQTDSRQSSPLDMLISVNLFFYVKKKFFSPEVRKVRRIQNGVPRGIEVY